MTDFKQLVCAAWDAAWNRGEVAALDEIVHADYLQEKAGSPGLNGVTELKSEVLEVRAAFPDLRTTVDKIFVEGDDFAVFWSSTGTFTNPLRDVPATGTRVQTRGSVQGLLRDGRVARERVSWDLRDLLTDVGVPTLHSAFEIGPAGTGAPERLSVPDAESLKEFNRKFVTGVTVVTTRAADGRPRGLAANAYTSVSLDPPLVLVCVQKSSWTHPALFESRHLGINILANTQRHVVERFSSKVQDKFAGVAWHGAPAGSPLIDGSAGAIETEIKERFQAKTHTVFIARVTYAEVSELAPMVYQAGRFYDGAMLEELRAD
ncbi:hypothetical protein GCM10009547_01050 [Sporichthya brevicatena]|uniref:Flavin reductase like domain-containing protein n=1 Tax=Sporichthya brevicatena TaxID=171442 RepID=A0ABN1G374_9ACTN